MFAGRCVCTPAPGRVFCFKFHPSGQKVFSVILCASVVESSIGRAGAGMKIKSFTLPPHAHKRTNRQTDLHRKQLERKQIAWAKVHEIIVRLSGLCFDGLIRNFEHFDCMQIGMHN